MNDALIQQLMNEISELRRKVEALSAQDSGSGTQEPLTTGADTGELIYADGLVVMVTKYR